MRGFLSSSPQAAGLLLAMAAAACQAPAARETCRADCTGLASAGVGGGAGSGGALAMAGGAGPSGAGARAGTAGMPPDGGGPLPPSYEPVVYTLPEPDDAVPCAGSSAGAATIERVAFAQTHVMEPSWPFFFLIAQRPALVEVIATGAGPAPDVRVEGFAAGASLGALCLAGPATLPSSVELTSHQKSDRYTASLPAAWLRPGLSITVTAGAAERTFSAEQLGVGAAPELNLVMVPMDVLNFNDGKPDTVPPDTWLADFAAAMPTARVRFGMFPARMALPRLVVSGDGEGGIAPTLLERRPCRDGETAGPECVVSDVPDGNINAAALQLIEALHKATGEFSYAYYYGNTEAFFPGGWGGGKNFVGADFGGVFLHEMGHALSLPHWGEGSYQNTTPGPGDYRYPYGGNGNDGGGRGETWNYYQNIAEYVSPRCQLKDNDTFGLERSDAMQRNDWCEESRSTGQGPWDGFGDFSAFAMYRFMVGAETAYAGQVPYRAGEVPFHLSEQAGFPTLVVDAAAQHSLLRSQQPTTQARNERFDFLVPQQWSLPVATLYGSYHPGFPEADVLYAPLTYQGTLPKVLDPTDPETFSALAGGQAGPYEDYFWWPKDLTFKITYADDTVLHALYPHDSVDREWSLGSGPWRRDLLYFALNVPGAQPIRRVELYERPFVVRHADMSDAGNIANPSLGITSQNFMTGAKLVASWEPP